MDYKLENKDSPERDWGAGLLGLPPLPTALNPHFLLVLYSSPAVLPEHLPGMGPLPPQPSALCTRGAATLPEVILHRDPSILDPSRSKPKS